MVALAGYQFAYGVRTRSKAHDPSVEFGKARGPPRSPHGGSHDLKTRLARPLIDHNWEPHSPPGGDRLSRRGGLRLL